MSALILRKRNRTNTQTVSPRLSFIFISLIMNKLNHSYLKALKFRLKLIKMQSNGVSLNCNLSYNTDVNIDACNEIALPSNVLI